MPSKSRNRNPLSDRRPVPGFARFSKNFVNQWSVPAVGYGPMEHDLLLRLDHDSQQHGRRHVEFASANALLQQIRPGADGGKQHEALRRALENLTALRFDFDQWYIPRKKGERVWDPDDEEDIDEFADLHDMSGREAKKAIRAQNRAHYRRRVMGCVEEVKWHRDGGMTVVLDPTFFKVNRVKRYYGEAHLADALRLKTLTGKRLLQLVRAYSAGDTLSYDIGKWARLLGLYDTHLTRWRAKFRDTVKAVEEVRNGALDVRETRDGAIKVTIGSAQTGERGEHQLGGRAANRHRREAREIGRKAERDPDPSGNGHWDEKHEEKLYDPEEGFYHQVQRFIRNNPHLKH